MTTTVRPSRRAILAGSVAALASPSVGRAQAYPTRPVTLIVPWTAGSASDAALRVIAEAAGRRLKQQIVVENKPGLGGVRGAIELASTGRPDGYLVSQMPITVFRYPFTSKVTFDPLRDFTYVVQLTGYTFGVVVRADSPFRSFPELVAYAKAHPGRLTYGSPGTHTSLHIVMLQIGDALGIEWTHVPYRGGAETTKALLAGDVMAVADSSGWGPQVESGEFRLLTTWGRERSKTFPTAPTLMELGYGIASTSPYGIAAPKDLDPTIVAILHDAFKAALSDRMVLTVLGNLGQEVEYLGSADYAASVPAAVARERAIVEKLGIKAG